MTAESKTEVFARSPKMSEIFMYADSFLKEKGVSWWDQHGVEHARLAIKFGGTPIIIDKMSKDGESSTTIESFTHDPKKSEYFYKRKVRLFQYKNGVYEEVHGFFPSHDAIKSTQDSWLCLFRRVIMEISRGTTT